jgi:ankyrin repeat protein
MTPLHCASLAGNLSFVQYGCHPTYLLPLPLPLNALFCRYLISKHSNINAADNFGFTPLHHAAFIDAANVCL